MYARLRLRLRRGLPRKNFPQENLPASFSGEKPPREIPKEFPGPSLGNLTDSTRNGAGATQTTAGSALRSEGLKWAISGVNIAPATFSEAENTAPGSPLRF